MHTARDACRGSLTPRKPEMAEPLLIAKHDTIECHLLPGLANRHGRPQ